MTSYLDDEVIYNLPLFNVIKSNHQIQLNQLIGSTIRISYSGIINCVVTGKNIKKPMEKACLMMPLDPLL